MEMGKVAWLVIEMVIELPVMVAVLVMVLVMVWEVAQVQMLDEMMVSQLGMVLDHELALAWVQKLVLVLVIMSVCWSVKALVVRLVLEMEEWKVYQ